MVKIIDGRGTGKSSRLFLLAKENNGVILCNNPELMREKAYRYGIVGLDFISYGQYFYDYNDIDEIVQGRPVYIDDLSQYLLCYDPSIAGYSESEDE